MKPRHTYLPLAAGLVTPWAVIYVLNVYFGTCRIISAGKMLRESLAGGLGDIVFTILLPLIPFVALIWATRVFSKSISGTRLECVFWGGFIPVWGFTAYGHWGTWYPFCVPGMHVSSTSAIAFLFIPIYGLFFGAIGLLVGWGISFLVPRKRLTV